MLGYKAPLTSMSKMIGYKKPLGFAMIGHKSPVMEDLPKRYNANKELEQNKKQGGLERSKRREGSTLGMYA
jgi:hypothetical protein